MHAKQRKNRKRMGKRKEKIQRDEEKGQEGREEGRMCENVKGKRDNE